jgi:hypothetical protein
VRIENVLTQHVNERMRRGVFVNGDSSRVIEAMFRLISSEIYESVLFGGLNDTLASELVDQMANMADVCCSAFCGVGESNEPKVDRRKGK